MSGGQFPEMTRAFLRVEYGGGEVFEFTAGDSATVFSACSGPTMRPCPGGQPAVSTEPESRHPGLYGSDGNERGEDDCPATFPAIGLECALMTGHDNGWHWDPRGVEWREEPGTEPLFGGAQPEVAKLAETEAALGNRATAALDRLAPNPGQCVRRECPNYGGDHRECPRDPFTEYQALAVERARLEYTEVHGQLSPAAKARLRVLRAATTVPVNVTAGQPAYTEERARLEWLMAYAPYVSPEDKRRWEELRAPEVAALKADIDRQLLDEVVRPWMEGQ